MRAPESEPAGVELRLEFADSAKDSQNAGILTAEACSLAKSGACISEDIMALVRLISEEVGSAAKSRAAGFQCHNDGVHKSKNNRFLRGCTFSKTAPPQP